MVPLEEVTSADGLDLLAATLALTLTLEDLSVWGARSDLQVRVARALFVQHSIIAALGLGFFTPNHLSCTVFPV